MGRRRKHGGGSTVGQSEDGAKEDAEMSEERDQEAGKVL